MKSETIVRLQEWYIAHCDGTWEHSFGVLIDTIDNPGWKLKINFAETELVGREFVEVIRDFDTEDWIRCKICDEAYCAYGGPKMLDEMINIFLKWAEQEK